jgi:toxin-antitoxin system PIN domain toxin
MIIPDINLLLYAYDSSSLFHAKAAAWWASCMGGTEPIGLPPVVLFGFMRVGTNTRAFENPMTSAEAAGNIRAWLEQPAVELLEGGPKHVAQVLQLLETLGTAGNLVSDAQIAALALDHDAVLHTGDTDFMRFPGLRWFNPLTGMSSAGLRKATSGK